jgi:hypothetical protein
MWAHTVVTLIEQTEQNADKLGWDDWLPFIGGAIAALVALVVFIGGGIFQFRQQRREFDNRRVQWVEQQQMEREGWAEVRAAERERQLLAERHRTYTSYIAGLDAAGLAAARVATRALHPSAQVSSADTATLLQQLGVADLPVPPPHPVADDLTWDEVRDAAQTVGSLAILLARNEHRSVMIEPLKIMWDPGPHEEPEAWLHEIGVPDSGPRTTKLRRARNEVERIARRELGIADQERQV